MPSTTAVDSILLKERVALRGLAVSVGPLGSTRELRDEIALCHDAYQLSFFQHR
jgi:hypothetical protein